MLLYLSLYLFYYYYVKLSWNTRTVRGIQELNQEGNLTIQMKASFLQKLLPNQEQ